MPMISQSNISLPLQQLEAVFDLRWKRNDIECSISCRNPAIIVLQMQCLKDDGISSVAYVCGIPAIFSAVRINPFSPQPGEAA